jgi:putative ABC transport system substrate-binding protein
MNRKIIVWLLTTLLLTAVSARAQQPGKIPWIGYIAGSGSGPAPAFIQGLRDLGYFEGKNLAIVYRTTEGRSERYADLAAELVSLNVDIMVTDTTSAALALKKVTSTIPIVMMSSTDPVGTGLIASLARPGGNITGLTSVSAELGGKMLELLKESVPGLNRVGVLGQASPENEFFVRETEPSARSLGVKVILLAFRGPEDFENTFRSATKERINGVVERLGPLASTADRKRFVEFTVKNRLPAISVFASWPVAGGLMSYGADRNTMYHRAATYVDKILKGTKPADLPVEQPTKFEFVINLKTAMQIGLTIPPNVLVRADRVIR